MERGFGEVLRRLRTDRGLSQQQLADCLFVDRSSIARWENGKRVPDLTVLARLAEALGVELEELLRSAEVHEAPRVLLVDDERIILTGGIPLLEALLPGAAITGFTNPLEALDYARAHPVSIVFLDIEMGQLSGLDLCRDFLRINPTTNVVFLTAYMEYSYDAWDTGACGFLLKPMDPDAVRSVLARLPHKVRGLEE